MFYPKSNRGVRLKCENRLQCIDGLQLKTGPLGYTVYTSQLIPRLDCGVRWSSHERRLSQRHHSARVRDRADGAVCEQGADLHRHIREIEHRWLHQSLVLPEEHVSRGPESALLDNHRLSSMRHPSRVRGDCCVR